ncbi:hypothetical protein JQN72_07875 [Phycicoccus sp. CSK15P-2]|uniref:hypothetical protein n=1 Tax=Phycicoccus sp. CSK15P-2 TaxID=2807627 RepID=UPI00195230AF|nr:hypothetical protein [Phycicoccus sp. CSK15P-2]MBM6404161.1 hypothetical protein [Phycicoccus sp. CSK15P-2]
MRDGGTGNGAEGAHDENGANDSARRRGETRGAEDADARVDRLFAEITAIERVDWPEAESGPRHPPRPSQTRNRASSAGRAQTSPRRRDLMTGLIALVLLALAVGGHVVLPHVSGWVDYLVHGDPRFRVDARSASAAAAPPLDGRVRAAVALPDDPGDDRYAFMQRTPSGGPVTFDPCQPIHYVVHDPYGVGEAGQDVVAEAVSEMSAATGLAFVFDGYTEEEPDESRPSRVPMYSSRWAPVLIAWSDPEETPRLEGSVVGVGGPVSFGPRDGHRWWVTGAVTLDTPALAPQLGSADGRTEVRGVVMHELGHVLGASHSESSADLMHAQGGTDGLSDGDRYAFAMLGDGVCIASP